MSQEAYPVVELIAQNVEAELRKVRVVGGYLNDAEVERAKRTTRPRDRLCVIHQLDPIEGDTTQGQNGSIEWYQPFEVHCYIVESETSEIPLDQRLNTIGTDVQRAIMEDPHRGDLAHDTLLDEPENFIDAAGHQFEGVIVKFRCRYRTSLSDPRIQR